MDAGGTSPRTDEVERSRKLEPGATHGAVVERIDWPDGRGLPESGDGKGVFLRWWRNSVRIHGDTGLG